MFFSCLISLATGISDSLWILGYLDWLNVRILILNPVYFLISFKVSSSVLKEFIKTNGTSAS